MPLNILLAAHGISRVDDVPIVDGLAGNDEDGGNAGRPAAQRGPFTEAGTEMERRAPRAGACRRGAGVLWPEPLFDKLGRREGEGARRPIELKEIPMALPKKIVIHELGPREGMQIEKNPVSTAEKVRPDRSAVGVPLSPRSRSCRS
jgi:hypothetical protein